MALQGLDSIFSLFARRLLVIYSLEGPWLVGVPSQLFFSTDLLLDLYFTCFTYNATSQGFLLARDLKLAQYVHLAPRHTFTVQVIGAVVGALMNYVMMVT